MTEKKKLLMTGASGLVGSRFVEMFSDKYDIVNIDLTTGVDITDQDSVGQFILAHPAGALIHLAAFTNTTEAEKQSGDKSGICYKVNVNGTRNIAETCATRNIYLVHVSTDFVFDGTKNAPYVEEDPRSPIDWYGETKVMAEETVETSSAKYAIARISYPYRANFALKPDIVTKIRAGLIADSLPPQFDDTLITPTFTDDIARAFDVMMVKRVQGIYHIVGSTALSPYELAIKVAKLYGVDALQVKKGNLTEYLKENPRAFARNAAVSNQKAEKELELSFFDIDKGLEEVKKQQETK